MPTEREQAAKRIEAGMNGRKKRQEVAEKKGLTKRDIQKMDGKGGGYKRDKVAGAGSHGSSIAGAELTEYEKGMYRNAFDETAKGRHSCHFKYGKEWQKFCKCPKVPTYKLEQDVYGGTRQVQGPSIVEPEIKVDWLLNLMRSLKCNISNGGFEKLKTKWNLEDFGEEERDDRDNDGQIGYWITFPMFCDIMRENKPDYRKEQASLKKAFDLWDTNDDGFIDEDEFFYVLTNCGEKMDEHDIRAVVKQFQEADGNNDGKISKDEFVKFFMSRHAGK